MYNYQINIVRYHFKQKQTSRTFNIVGCTRCNPEIVNRVKDNLRSPEIFKSFFSLLSLIGILLFQCWNFWETFSF